MEMRMIERSRFMAEKQFQKDDVIFHQGDEGNSFYQVIDGSVGIFVSYDDEENIKLTELHKGELFGEMAVIDAYPRSGSAVALEDGTKLKEIAADDLDTYFKSEPENIVLLMKTLSKRIRDLTEDYEKVKETAAELDVEASSIDKSSLRALKKYSNFRQRKIEAPSAEVAREVQKHVKGFAKNVASYPSGTIICKEGDTVKCMYDIQYGRVGIFSHFGQEDQVQLTTLSSNCFFGEMGMVDEAPRSATAVALDDETTVETIYPEDFAELFEKNPLKVNQILQHISSRLRTLTSQYCDTCEKIAQKLEEKG